MEKTDWFKELEKPVRVGVYERRVLIATKPTYQHWNGKFWGLFHDSPAGAFNARNDKSDYQRGSWRGLMGPK
jgi:regulation of enolase protein 1 (concanavalin A-like superfamily)